MSSSPKTSISANPIEPKTGDTTPSNRMSATKQWQRAVMLVIRLFPTFLVAWALLWTIRSYEAWRRPAAEPVESTTMTEPQLPRFPDITMLLDGGWVFAELPWRIRIVELDPADRPAPLESKLYVRESELSAATAIERDLTSLAISLCAKPAVGDGRRIYRGETVGNEIMLVTSDSSNPRLLGLQALFTRGDGSRSSLEILPLATASLARVPHAGLLVPGLNVRLLASRTNIEGGRLAEVVEYGAWPDVEAQCRRDGWGCRSFTSDASIAQLALVRDGHRRTIWRLSPDASGEGTALIMNDDLVGVPLGTSVSR